MQAISPNRISQGQHGATKAVDYSAVTDQNIYAPEDGTIDSYQRRGSGKSDAGNALRLKGKSGLHQFAHCEALYVKVGSKVKKGQVIAKMGYTGYTIPSGPAGRHCHWWIYRSNGTYVYPPSLINEKFTKYSAPKPPAKHPFAHLVGRMIQLRPKNGRWSVYKENSDTKLGTLIDRKDLFYIVRGVSKRKNSVLINSGTFGNGIRLPLADSKGKDYKGEYKVVK